MTYQDKYFDQDKNSILRAAQGFVEPQLINKWIEIALQAYQVAENPMGLLDDFILKVQSVKNFNRDFLREPYVLLSAIYRLKEGDNQLQFLWDGRSHYEVYAEQWTLWFQEEIISLSEKKEVYRAILKACILNEEVNQKFLFYALRRTLLSKYDLAIDRKQMLVG